MAYDEPFAQRIRAGLDQLAASAGTSAFQIEEKKMFGGICFMVNTHMACGVAEGGTLMLRLGEEGAVQALTEPHTRPMDFTGRPLKSMVYVEPEGVRTDRQLGSWLKRATDFARSQPRKARKKK